MTTVSPSSATTGRGTPWVFHFDKTLRVPGHFRLPGQNVRFGLISPNRTFQWFGGPTSRWDRRIVDLTVCSRRLATYPTSKLVLMTVAEAAIELNLETADVVYRLLRFGKLRGTKRGKTWDVDADSVAERKRSVELKRSSRSNAQAERARRVAQVEAMFS
jgi:hypothetical protein